MNQGAAVVEEMVLVAEIGGQDMSYLSADELALIGGGQVVVNTV